MHVLVANLGSTSFKYRLFRLDEEGEVEVARGGYERVTAHGEAIDKCLTDLRENGHLERVPDAVGFKTVLGRGVSGCVPADEAVLDALEGFQDVAPAHNPAYAAGIRAFRDKLPGVPLYALFETAFYQWVDEAASRYAVPKAWHDAGVRRYGFHGASHKFVGERSAELAGRDDVAAAARELYRRGPGAIDGAPFRVISCHLGGSSSITGIRNGVAVGTSMGLSPQSGVPQNNRVGDLDAMAIPFVARTLGLSLEEIEQQMSKEGGLLGLSGVSNDLRDIAAAAESGNADAQVAMDVFVHEIRRWVGAFLVQLGGCDALVFTGGIGENRASIRAGVCAGLGAFGIALDPERNESLAGAEGEIGQAEAAARVFVIPANEELVVAREVRRQIVVA